MTYHKSSSASRGMRTTRGGGGVGATGGIGGAGSIIAALAAGAAIGAACMYLFDPIGGNRRRAMARDKSTRYARETGRYLTKKGRYHAQRAGGMAQEAIATFRSDEATDRQLAERVRAALGRATRHSSAIQVQAGSGTITLSGSIPADEIDCILEAARKVRGVEDVVNRLTLAEESAQSAEGARRM